MTLPITAVTAAICAIMLLITAIDTVRHRMRTQTAFGDGADARLVRASRSHANLAEHAPVVLILLGLLEMSRADSGALAVIAGTFIVARIAHIVGLYAPVSTKPPLPRSIGVILTWLVLAVLIVWTLWSVAA